MVRGNVQCEYFICTWCWGLKSSHTLYSSKFKVISRIDDCYTEKVHRHFERNKIKIYYSSTPRSTSDRDWQFSDLNLSCHAIKERKWLRKNNEQIDSNITGIPLGAQRWQQLTFIQQEQSLQKKKKKQFRTSLLATNREKPTIDSLLKSNKPCVLLFANTQTDQLVRSKNRTGHYQTKCSL